MLEVSRKKLGTGGGGVVWLGRHRSVADTTGDDGRNHNAWELVAVKRKFNSSKSSDGQGCIPNPEDEHYLVEAIPSHPHVIRQLGWYASTHDGSIYAALELMDGDLGSEVEKGNLPSPNGPLQMLMYTLLSAIEHIHAYGVVHRDIKPSNVLLKRDSGVDPATDPFGAALGLRVRLADFGAAHFATDQKRDAMHIRGTRSYQSPEALYGRMCEGGVDAAASDIWGAGCTFYELLLGRRLFSGDSALQMLPMMLGKLGATMSTYPNKATPASFPTPLRKELEEAGVSAAAIDLLERMLELDPLQRLSASELLATQYFDIVREYFYSPKRAPMQHAYTLKTKPRNFDISHLDFKDVGVGREEGSAVVSHSFDLNTSGCQTARTVVSRHTDHTCSQMRPPRLGLFGSCSTMKRSATAAKQLFTTGSTGASESMPTFGVAGALFADDDDDDDEVMGLHNNNNVAQLDREGTRVAEDAYRDTTSPTRHSPITPMSGTPSFRSQGRKMRPPTTGAVSFRTSANARESSPPTPPAGPFAREDTHNGRNLTNSAIKAQEQYYSRLAQQKQQQENTRALRSNDARDLLSPQPTRRPPQSGYAIAKVATVVPGFSISFSRYSEAAMLPGQVSAGASPQLVRIDEVNADDELDEQENKPSPRCPRHDLNSSDASSVETRRPTAPMPRRLTNVNQSHRPAPLLVRNSERVTITNTRFVNSFAEAAPEQCASALAVVQLGNSPSLKPTALRWSTSTGGSSSTPVVQRRLPLQTLQYSPNRASASPRKLRFDDSPQTKPQPLCAESSLASHPILSPLGPAHSPAPREAPLRQRHEVNRYFNVCNQSVVDEIGRVVAPHSKRSAERTSAEDLVAGCPSRIAIRRAD